MCRRLKPASFFESGLDASLKARSTGTARDNRPEEARSTGIAGGEPPEGGAFQNGLNIVGQW
jgi:hypothetical protein